MNDEKKEPNAGGVGDPGANAWPVEDDDNPWDDDGGGRTLATGGPTFEVPSNVPSPITVPPAALAPPAPPVASPVAWAGKRAPMPTLAGLMPEDLRALVSGPAASPPRPPAGSGSAPDGPAPESPRVLPGPPASYRAPSPVVLADAALAELPGHRDDAPTMAVPLSSLAQRPPRDDGASPHGGGALTAASRRIDPDAETLAPASAPLDAYGETLDANVIFAEDAIGDDATLAIPPGQLGLGLGLGGGPAPPTHAVPPGSSGRFPAVPNVTMPQGAYGGPAMHPPAAAPPPSSPMGWGTPSSARPAFGPGMPPQGVMAVSPPWMTRAVAPPPPVGGPIRMTSQIIVLVGAGVVCVTIFVIGVVLFVTTKF